MPPGDSPRTQSSAPRSVPEVSPPSIPNFELLRCIGQGGYGEVWLARNLLGSFCAIKVVCRHRTEGDRPYEREFDGLKRFEPVSKSHPSQIGISYIGRDAADGFFYYAMELADDRTSGQHIVPENYRPKTLRSELQARGRLPVEDCLDIALALTQALEHLHANGLVHRDIKPSNVIFVHGRPKLADIGLVAAADEEHSFVGGTTGYVPPEGPGKAADIFALGKVLYEMNTGLGRDRFPSLPAKWAQTPDRRALELNQAILRACEANPTRRYRSATAMREELEFLKSQRSLLVQRWIERTRRRVLQVAALLLVLTVAIAFGTIIRQRTREIRRQQKLHEAQKSRAVMPYAGWSDEAWEKVRSANSIRMDEQVMQQASASMAGLDARVRKHYETNNVAACAAAFGPDGSVLICGHTGQAMLMDTNGLLRHLPVSGCGTVGWARDRTALHLSVAPGRCMLRDAFTGDLRSQFMVPPPLHNLPPDDVAPALAEGGGFAAAVFGQHVLVWDTGNSNVLGVITNTATALAFSPDSSLLAVGSRDGRTEVFSLPSLLSVKSLPPAERPSKINCLAFARDRAVPDNGARSNAWLLAAGDQGAQVLLWNLQRGVLPRPLHGATWMVSALAFHPNNQLLVAVGQGPGVVWDIARDEVVLRLQFTGAGQARFVCISEDGRRLACGGYQHDKKAALTLAEFAFHRGVHVLRGLSGASRQLWLSPDGGRVAAISDNWELAIWEIDPERLLFRFVTPGGETADNAGGCFSPDGQRFCFAALTAAREYDLRTGDIRQRWNLPPGFAEQVVFDTQGRRLLLRREQSPEGSRYEWLVRQLSDDGFALVLWRQSLTNESTRGVAFVPGGEHFLVWNGWLGEAKQVLRVYHTASGKEVHSIPTGMGECDLRVVLEPNGRFMAMTASEASPSFRLFRLPQFVEIGRTVGACQAINQFGDQFTGGEPWWLENPANPSHNITLDTDRVELGFVAAFSRDGDRLAYGTEQGVVLVAELPEVRRRMIELRHGRAKP